MAAVEQSLNYEDLLHTVQETDRGRWFLAEFESRLRKSDTVNILAAIAKLENVVASTPPANADSVLVARAKSAIAAARKEIAAIEKAGLSDEGRLFAKLADMARTAFASDGQEISPANAGVCRALLLVDQLDQDFATVPALPTATTAFARDADVFEVPAKAIPAPVKATVKEPVKEVERGAKLVIRKAGEVQAAVAAVAVPDVKPPEAAPPAVAAVAAEPPVAESTVQPLAPPPEKQSRVVIIRRKPEELMDVPMVDEAPAETAA